VTRTVTPYRWAVLGSFALVNAAIQTLWISYAPITLASAQWYGASELAIGLFAMSFMIAFIPLSIPASWAIDRYGFRPSVGVGAAMMGLFGVLRGLSGADYGAALWCTVGLAASQPLLLNSWTTVPAKWFPRDQRATAVGLVTIGNLAGTAVGMIAPPVMLDAGMDVQSIQLAFGIGAAASAVLFLAFARERPKNLPSADSGEARALVLDGLKSALSKKGFLLSLAVSFVGLGVFNGVTTWIELIVSPRGFGSSFAGTLGAVMIAGGLAGAVLLPALSDRTGRRRPFLALSFAGAIPALLGLAFANSAAALLASSAALGFFLVSAFPVVMQYASETALPTPEGASNGLMQLFGQGAVVFVYAMEALKGSDGSFARPLVFASAMLALALAAVSGMKDTGCIKDASCIKAAGGKT